MQLCKIQRLLARAIVVFVLLIAVLVIQPIAAYAASNPLYINAVLTEPVTKVGQLPKIVQTFGNRGSRLLADVDASCDYFKLTSQWAIDSSFKVTERPQAMNPGQNTNRETAVRAIAPGQVRVVCQVKGRDAVTSEQFTAFSTPVALTVKP